MDEWGFWLQVVGSLLVLVGLSWTWAWWSPRRSAERFRDGWEAFTAWRRQRWARLRGRSVGVTGGVASGSITLSGSGSASAMGLSRPPVESIDLRAWVLYLEGRIAQAEGQTAVLRRQQAEGFEAVRGEIARGLADSRDHVESVAKAHREALTRANLSGLGLAALGGLLTFAGLLMVGPPVPA